MSIYAIGFGIMLLIVQAYSASQSNPERKIALWKAIIMSVFWFLTVPAYLLMKADVGGVSASIKKIFKSPIA